MTPQERAAAFVQAWMKQPTYTTESFINDVLEHDKQTRRAALLEACVAVSQFSSDGRPIDTQELRIALVQLLGEMAK